HGAELRKSLNKLFVAAGKVFDELAGFFATVGDIATAAARYFHFGQEFGGLFQHRYLEPAVVGSHIGRRKNPRRSGAYNDDVTVFHWFRIYPCLRAKIGNVCAGGNWFPDKYRDL